MTALLVLLILVPAPGGFRTVREHVQIESCDAAGKTSQRLSEALGRPILWRCITLDPVTLGGLSPWQAQDEF